MILFTTGDILKLMETIPATTFDDWCAKGIVRPISGGSGTGNHRQWSLMQAVGFVVVEEMRRSERGCMPAFIGKTVDAFANVSEAWLIKQFQQSNRHYLFPHFGKPLLKGDPRYQPNAEAAHRKVLKFAKQKGKAKEPCRL